MSPVLRRMNSQTQLRPRVRRHKKMERRAIAIAVLLAVIIACVLHQTVLSTSNPPQDGLNESGRTVRPFSANGDNHTKLPAQSKGILTRIKHFFAAAPVPVPSKAPPRYRTAKYGAVDVAYREHENPKGVVLLFHGCGESAHTWYTLPEHNAISIALHKQRFSTLAISSANRGSKCWSSRFPAGENADVARVLMAVRHYYEQHHHPEQFPLHGVGASSGGSFSAVFSTTGRILSQVLYISPGNRKAFRHSRKGYPRTLFVHAENDSLFPVRTIEASKEDLLKRGVNVGIFPQQPPKVTDLLYATRVPNLHRAHSVKLAAAKDIKSFMGLVSKLPNDVRSGVGQVRKVVEGGHAVSSTGADDIAAWI